MLELALVPSASGWALGLGSRFMVCPGLLMDIVTSLWCWRPRLNPKGCGLAVGAILSSAVLREQAISALLPSTACVACCMRRADGLFLLGWQQDLGGWKVHCATDAVCAAALP